MTKNLLLLIILTVTLITCSYSQSEKKVAISYLSPSVIPKNLMNWLYYERENVFWSANYKAFDTALNALTREKFLDALTTGNYMPIKIGGTNDTVCYQLYYLDISIDIDIKNTIANKAKIEYRYLQMEGKPLPNFHFIDLENNTYSKETTAGKIVVLNCWFIHCTSCVAEIPQLNQLVKSFKNKKDLLFIGLAFDKPNELSSFLATTKFNYKIVPNMTDYLLKDLQIYGYPTHLVVNKEGIIVRVIENNISELMTTLKREIEL